MTAHVTPSPSTGVNTGPLDVLDRLLVDASACLTCGKAHERRQEDEARNLWTLADRIDGHAYRPPYVGLDWLRRWVAEQRRAWLDGST